MIDSLVRILDLCLEGVGWVSSLSEADGLELSLINLLA